MTRNQVKSSYVESIGYDGDIMEVAFKSGKVYRYIGIPASLYESVIGAESIGRAVKEQVVKGGFEAEQVEPETEEED